MSEMKTAIDELEVNKLKTNTTIDGTANRAVNDENGNNIVNNYAKIANAIFNGTMKHGENDLAGSAIVAKSIGSNGYVKYASGLIIQWGATVPKKHKKCKKV